MHYLAGPCMSTHVRYSAAFAIGVCMQQAKSDGCRSCIDVMLDGKEFLQVNLIQTAALERRQATFADKLENKINVDSL